MHITKILRVESPVRLWKMIQNREEILETADGDVYRILSFFMDSVDTYVNGCRCDEEKNYSIMMCEYDTSLRREDVQSHLIKCFGCDKIYFI